MRRLSLTIASFASILSVPVLLYLGVALFPVSIIGGLLVICAGIPIAISLSVVFDYVAERMDIARKEAESSSRLGDDNSVTRGTPWETDPGHTNEQREN